MKPDSTYFSSGITLVPNQTSVIGGVTTTSNSAELTKYIDRYSVVFLKQLLGSLYPDYVANEKDARWVALNAKLYDTTLKISPVANFVFWHYYNDSTRRNTPTGVAVQRIENAQIVTDQRLCQVWNEMVELMYNEVDGVLDWLHESDQTTTYVFDHSTTDWRNFIRTSNEFGL